MAGSAMVCHIGTSLVWYKP